jgi:hypothetical protein
MIYRVEFFKNDKRFHSKEWEYGLDTAKQHATGMLKPYEATFARIVDEKGREVFTCPSPEEMAQDAALNG